MSREVIVRPAAERDIRKAHSWYREMSAGLGEQFKSAVDQASLRPQRTRSHINSLIGLLVESCFIDFRMQFSSSRKNRELWWSAFFIRRGILVSRKVGDNAVCPTRVSSGRGAVRWPGRLRASFSVNLLADGLRHVKHRAAETLIR